MSASSLSSAPSRLALLSRRASVAVWKKRTGIPRVGRNGKEIMVPKIEVSGLSDYTRNVGYKTGPITYKFETKTFNYDRSTTLLTDVMDVEEAGATGFSTVGKNESKGIDRWETSRWGWGGVVILHVFGT